MPPKPPRQSGGVHLGSPVTLPYYVDRFIGGPRVLALLLVLLLVVVVLEISRTSVV